MKLGVLIAAGVAVIAGLAFLLPAFVHGNTPSAEIHVLVNGKYELVNSGNSPLHYTGYGPAHCLASWAYADPSKPVPRVGICGTGLGSHSLDPGKSVFLSPYLPPEAFAGDKIIVKCHLYGKPSGWWRLRNWAVSEIPGAGRVFSPSPTPSIVVSSKAFVPLKTVAATP